MALLKGLLDEAVSGIKQLVKKAEDFLPWDEEVTYIDEATNGVITLAKFPDGRTSVIKLEVPEEFRGKGVAKKLQAKAMNDNPNLTGQVSSKKAATSAYNLGRRPINNPNATLEEVYAAIDDMSSVNMATPDAIKAFNNKGGVDVASSLSGKARGLMDQYDMDLYHSTYADIDQFDPDMVDIGVHLGTPQQAKNRLNDTFDPDGGGARFKTENYREGANVMPVKVRSGGVLEMEDVGDWKNSQEVLSELTKNPLFQDDPVINDLIGYADEIQPSYYGGEMSWRDSPENREVLDEIRSHLQDKGFDTVKYLNQVENSYGNDAGFTEAATKSRDLLFKRINEIQKVAHSRGPDINSVPDPSAPNFQEKMDAFLNGKPSYTDAETVELDKLRADARFIGSAPESQADPNSYISLDPDRNVRSRFAKFESERGSLLSSNPVATAAGLGGVLAMTGSDDSYAGGPQSQYDPTSMSGVLGISPEMIEAMAQKDALDQQRMAADQQRYGQYADDQMMPREQTYSEQLGNYLSNLRYGDDSDKQQQEMARVLSGILDFTPVGSADALKLGAQQREAGNSFEGWLNSIGGAAEAAIPLAGLGYKYGKKRLQGLMERF